MSVKTPNATPNIRLNGNVGGGTPFDEELRTELIKAVEAAKLIKKCQAAAKSMQLTSEMGVDAVRSIVQLHQNLSRVAEQYASSGSASSVKILHFINNTFKQTVIHLGHGMKTLVKTGDGSALEKYTPEMVRQMRHMVEMLRVDGNSQMTTPPRSPTIDQVQPSPIQQETTTQNRKILAPPPVSTNHPPRASRASRLKFRSSRILTPAQIQELEMEAMSKSLGLTPVLEKPTENTPIKPIPPSITAIPEDAEREIPEDIPEEIPPPRPVHVEPEFSSFIGFHSDPGDRYGDTNQDSLMFCKSGENGYVFGVFDGHGANGEIASQVASKTFKEFFSTRDFFSMEKKQRHEVIKEVFQLAHQNIINEYQNADLKKIQWNGVTFKLDKIDGLMVYYNRKYGMMLQDFGTTALMAAVRLSNGRATDLVIANAGDSLVMVGRDTQNGEMSSMDNVCVCHNVHEPTELKRLEVFGVEIEENYIIPPEQSGFQWAQLAVARSLGHRYLCQYGIIPDPHISSYTLHKDDKYLVLTSDGITDVLSGKEIIDAVGWLDKDCEGNIQLVAEELVNRSLRVWEEEPDNTTAIVVKLRDVKIEKQK